jgi:hypothetical protein
MEEKELPGKAGIREAVVPYGPKEIERKLTEYIGEPRMELFKAVKDRVNPTGRPLKAVYLYSAWDVANLFPPTDATTAVYVDRNDMISGIKKEIPKMGGEVKEGSALQNRAQLEFEWNGKSRKLIFYKLDIGNDTIDKLLPEMRDADVYFSKKPEKPGSKVQESVIKSLKLGGFCISDSEVDKILGFEEIPLDEKFKSDDYAFGSGNLHLYRKTRDTPEIGKIIEFGKFLDDVESTRNGSINGVSENVMQQSMKTYKGFLIDLKKAFNSLPEEAKGELKQRVLDKLFNAPGDMSQVLDSPENYTKQYEYHKSLARMLYRGVLSEQEIEHFEMLIEDAQKSPNRPTAQQLDKFIEEGKKVFREVFPEWVS